MIKLLLILIIIIEAYHCYITSFNIVIRKNMIGSVSY